jgi:cytochrome c-type biogenesis protein CcmF
MVVHVGVVVIAVALTSAMAFGHRGEVQLLPGQTRTFDGHRITYVRMALVTDSVRSATEVVVEVDGRGPFRPAVTRFGSGTDPVGTPAVDSGTLRDIYLTVDTLPTDQTGRVDPRGAVAVGVTVQPLVSWLWVGGAILVIGSILAAVPGRRRRQATDAVSAPVPAVALAIGATSP